MRTRGLHITDKEKQLLSKRVEERLADGKKKAVLKTKLCQIALLCRLFNKKAEITYRDETKEIKIIVARVWLATCNNIVLKEGTSIPVTSILGVRVVQG